MLLPLQERGTTDIEGDSGADVYRHRRLVFKARIGRANAVSLGDPTTITCRRHNLLLFIGWLCPTWPSVL